jgi:hypothetical protein
MKDLFKYLWSVCYAIFVVRDRQLVWIVLRWPWLSDRTIAAIASELERSP